MARCSMPLPYHDPCNRPSWSCTNHRKVSTNSVLQVIGLQESYHGLSKGVLRAIPGQRPAPPALVSCDFRHTSR